MFMSVIGALKSCRKLIKCPKLKFGDFETLRVQLNLILVQEVNVTGEYYVSYTAFMVINMCEV